MSSNIVWSIKDLVEVAQNRQKNEFDVMQFISGRRGNGKCQIKGSKVLMANGEWKNIENIITGDFVMSPQFDGSMIMSKVIGVNNYFEKNVYHIVHVTRNKEILYTCSENHLLPIYKIFSPRIKGTLKRKRSRITVLRDANWLSKRYTSQSKYSTLSTFKIPYFLGCIDPNIDPYTLGIWIGDGHWSASNIGITSINLEVINKILDSYEIMSVTKKQNTDAKTYRFSVFSPFSKELKKLGLFQKKSGNKFIPKKCLLASYDFRINLLAGLIDSDGFVSKANQITYCTKSKQLALDVKDLVFSLGGYSNIRNITKSCGNFKGNYYDLQISFKYPKLIPIQVPMKKNRLKERKVDPAHIAVKAIKTHPQIVYGIEVDSPSKLYITDNWMITHNSSLNLKFSSRFKVFKPWKHIIYSRGDLMRIMEGEVEHVIMDDEAIRTGYKRNFYEQDQKKLITMFNMYRDNFNIYSGCIPNFYDLDKDLRMLCTLHIQVIRRGTAIIHIPTNKLYSNDPWDIKLNSKLEDIWTDKIKRDPDYSPPYHKLTTFAGYLYFGKLPPNQERMYKEIKRAKRKAIYNSEMGGSESLDPKEKLIDNVMNLLKAKQLTSSKLKVIALASDMKYTAIMDSLRYRLKNEMGSKTPSDFLQAEEGKAKKTNITKEQSIPFMR